MENKWANLLSDLETIQDQEKRLQEQEELRIAREKFASKYANRAERRAAARHARRKK